MSGEYDKILKENLEAVFLPLSEKFFGFKIDSARELPDKLQITLEREPDFLKIVKTSNEEEFILHLEFQTKDEKDMIERLREYHAFLGRKYKLQIKQYVIYLGDKAPKMRTNLEENEVFKGFVLKNLKEYHYQNLINSTIPEELILAILCNFENKDPLIIISSILQKLRELTQDEIALRKYIRQLGVLSRLRNLGETTLKASNNMAITFDIEQDFLFKKGQEKGIEKGIEKMIVQMLKTKELSVQKIAEIAEVPVAYVMKLAEKLTQEKP